MWPTTSPRFLSRQQQHRRLAGWRGYVAVVTAIEAAGAADDAYQIGRGPSGLTIAIGPKPCCARLQELYSDTIGFWWMKPLACPLILPPALLCLALARPSSGLIGWWRAGEHSVKPLAFDRSPARWRYSRVGSVPGRRSSGCDNAGNLRRPTVRS